VHRLDRFFEVSARKSTIAAELRGGVVTFIDGLIIVLLAVTGLRRMVFNAVPMQLKLAITAGIGLFILFIGLVDAGFIGSTGKPSPPVGLGAGGIGSINTVPTVVFVFTLLVTGILVVRRVRGGNVDFTWPAPGPLGQGRMNRSTALAKPSSSFVVVTQRAARLTSSLALPIAMLSPDWVNMSTSLGMSPIVAISSGAMS
jgi:hypothetical protein